MSRGHERWRSYVQRAQVRRFGGIDLCVYSLGDARRDEAIFEGLTAALRLIHAVQPWRAHMLPRHLERVLVVHPLGAEYVHSIRACAVGYRDVEEGSIPEVAESIVHELTHARIENCGIEYTEANRARIEHICTKAQFNFTRAAASAPRLTRGQMPALDPWWTEEHRVQRIVDQLRELRVPEWMVSAVLAVYRLRRRIMPPPVRQTPDRAQ